MTTMMHDHLTALLDAGHHVHLERWEEDGERPRYWAHVTTADGDRTAEGATPAEAIWTASPLHADDEPFPTACPAEIDGTRCTEDGEHQFHYGPDTGGGVRRMWTDADAAVAGDLDELHAEMDIITERVADLEAERDGDMRLLVRALADVLAMTMPDGLVATRGDKPTPARSWYCAKCGGQFTGEEPADHRCGGCSA
jgi:hypothetical protein